MSQLPENFIVRFRYQLIMLEEKIIELKKYVIKKFPSETVLTEEKYKVLHDIDSNLNAIAGLLEMTARRSGD